MTALLGLVLAAMMLPTASASATPPTAVQPTSFEALAAPGIDPFYGEDKWWNKAQSGASSSGGKWSRTDFPMPCQVNQSDRAIKVIWAYKEGTSNKFTQNGPGELRKTIRAANYTFTASLGRTLDNWVNVRKSKSPRYVGWQNNNNENSCVPNVTSVEIPTSVWNQPDDPNTADQAVDIWNYLASIGYNEVNRKYLVFSQWMVDPDRNYGGIAQIPAANDPYNTGTSNPANNSSFLLVQYNNYGQWPNEWEDKYKIVAHELSHAFGALTSAMPNQNTQNGAHAADMQDIMGYSPNAPGQFSACGNNNWNDYYEHRASYRLDCGNDDYFSWTALPWWTVDRSAYLWGNPQPPSVSGRQGAAVYDNFDVVID